MAEIEIDLSEGISKTSDFDESERESGFKIDWMKSAEQFLDIKPKEIKDFTKSAFVEWACGVKNNR